MGTEYFGGSIYNEKWFDGVSTYSPPSPIQPRFMNAKSYIGILSFYESWIRNLRIKGGWWLTNINPDNFDRTDPILWIEENIPPKLVYYRKLYEKETKKLPRDFKRASRVYLIGFNNQTELMATKIALGDGVDFS